MTVINGVTMLPGSGLKAVFSCILRELKDIFQVRKDPKAKHHKKLAALGKGEINTIRYKSTVTIPLPPASEHDNDTRKEHHIEGVGFENPWESAGFAPVYSRKKTGFLQRCRDKANRLFQRDLSLRVTFPNFEKTRDSTYLCATWMGHSSVYVEFGSGPRVLFDPVFEEVCIYREVETKRVTRAPCKIEDIPFIDIVIISNSHPDHLSYPTIKKIHQIHPFCQFFVPLGCKHLLTENGITRVTELDWWEKRNYEALPFASSTDSLPLANVWDFSAIIECLPCQYAGPIRPRDRSKGLWASWSVKYRGRDVFFAGATGYRTVQEPEFYDGLEVTPYSPSCPVFREIGRTRGHFDLACLPVGGYEPRAMMSPTHCDPQDVVHIYRDLKAAFGLVTGFGTWSTTNEEVKKMLSELEAVMSWYNITQKDGINCTMIGQTKSYSGTFIRRAPIFLSRSAWEKDDDYENVMRR
ncbi:hypothetical protein FQN49_000849 [Arthroderma sp. PD_2]|nr:hypothetical protein FQN49_000849 [Arthroderma sp. PD_2]